MAENALSSMFLSGSSDDSEKTLHDELVSPQEKPSTRIYRNLASDPIVKAVLAKKKPSYREMIFVTTTIVAALDKEVEIANSEIERLRPAADRLAFARDVWNRPIFGDTNKRAEKLADDKSNEELRIEASWVLKYLSLRNVCGVFISLIVLAAGFFAWWNQDHKSLLGVREKRKAELASELVKKNKIIDELQAAKDKSKSDIETLTFHIEAANQTVERTIKAAQIVSETAREGNLEEKKVAEELGALKEARIRLENINDLLTKDLNHLKMKEKEQQDTITSKSNAVSEIEKAKDKFQQERDNAVDAWNHILGFLARKVPGNFQGESAYIRRDEIEEHLKTIERLTAKTSGMKTKL